MFERADLLRPTTAVGGFKGDFDATKLRARLLGAASKPFVSLVLRREQPTVEYGISFIREGDLRLRVELLLSDLHDAGACTALLALLRSLSDVVEIIFARGHETSDADLSNRSRPNQTLDVPPEIDDGYWLTMWGRELVDRAGRSRVLSTPAHLVEELSNGTAKAEAARHAGMELIL